MSLKIEFLKIEYPKSDFFETLPTYRQEAANKNAPDRQVMPDEDIRERVSFADALIPAIIAKEEQLGEDAPCGTCGLTLADRVEKQVPFFRVVDSNKRAIHKADKGKLLYCACAPCWLWCAEAFAKHAVQPEKGKTD